MSRAYEMSDIPQYFLKPSKGDPSHGWDPAGLVLKQRARAEQRLLAAIEARDIRCIQVGCADPQLSENFRMHAVMQLVGSPCYGGDGTEAFVVKALQSVDVSRLKSDVVYELLRHLLRHGMRDAAAQMIRRVNEQDVALKERVMGGGADSLAGLRVDRFDCMRAQNLTGLRDFLCGSNTGRDLEVALSWAVVSRFDEGVERLLDKIELTVALEVDLDEPLLKKQLRQLYLPPKDPAIAFALCKAACQGKAEAIRLLCDMAQSKVGFFKYLGRDSLRDFPLLSYLQQGYMAMHYAADAGDVRIVQLLGRAGVKVVNDMHNQPTPIWYALYKEHRDCMAALVAAGESCDALFEGVTPLQWAVRYDRVDDAAYILELGADPNTYGHMGYSPLVMAACASKVGLVKLLLKAGAAMPSEHEKVLLECDGRLEVCEATLSQVKDEMHCQASALMAVGICKNVAVEVDQENKPSQVVSKLSDSVAYEVVKLLRG